MRVAVMQPYFYPYIGYFQLMAAVDLFILFDCVQFPRRGRVHRTQIPDGSEVTAWLTLPLAKGPRNTRINELSFADQAARAFADRCAPYSWLGNLPGSIADAMFSPMESVVDYLERNLRVAADYLQISTPFVRSSAFSIPESIRHSERVCAVVRAAGASRYLNASGGRSIYDSSDFTSHLIELEFLAAYTGSRFHILHSFASEDPDILAHDVAAFTIEPAEH